MALKLWKQAWFLCFMLGTLVFAGEPPGKKEEGVKTAHEPAHILVNPQTGKTIRIAGTTKGEQELLRMLDRSGSAVEREDRSDGTIIYHIRGGFAQVKMASVGPDGKKQRTCVDHVEDLVLFLEKAQEAKAEVHYE